MPQVSSNVAKNYRKVKTGSQLGTPQLQALMIKTYNINWGNLVTDTETRNDNIRISAPDSTFAKIIRAVQDYAEIYYIGNPTVAPGGETSVTECVVFVNVNTNTSGGELRSGLYEGSDSENRWLALEDHMHRTIETPEPIYVYFAVPEGWTYRVTGYVPSSNNWGNGFPYIAPY